MTLFHLYDYFVLISQVNNPYNLLVRRTACECLWELELSYPVFSQSFFMIYSNCCMFGDCHKMWDLGVDRGK